MLIHSECRNCSFVGVSRIVHYHIVAVAFSLGVTMPPFLQKTHPDLILDHIPVKCLKYAARGSNIQQI